MQLANAANGAAGTAWPFDMSDGEPCLFGLFLRAAIRHELYRISGNPYELADNRGGFDFLGAECPTPFRDVRPEAVRPLTEKAREASAYASRKMRAAPVRLSPLASPHHLGQSKISPPSLNQSPPMRLKSNSPSARQLTMSFAFNSLTRKLVRKGSRKSS